MYTLLSSPRTSPHANIIISKIPSEDFLNIASPELEDLPSRFYEITLASNEYTSYTQNVTLINFFSDCVDSFKNPVATLGSSSSLPISPADNIENIGLAVFKNDILVGELNAEESILHMMVSNKLKSCTISIPNPIGDSESINLSIKLAHNTKNSVSLVNGTPFISSVVKINAKIESATQKSSYGNSSYYSKENIQLIEESCNQYLKKALNDYLYKTAKEFNKEVANVNEAANKKISNIEVSAYASPDGGVSLNTTLAENRESNTTKMLSKDLKKAKIDAPIDAKYTAQDWEGFQELVSKSNIQDKELILRVIAMYQDPAQRESEIKNISAVYLSLIHI